MELATAVIGLLVAIIGIPTAIMGLRKEYLEKKNSSGAEGKDMSKLDPKRVAILDSEIEGDVSTNIDSNNVTINGNVTIGKSEKTQDVISEEILTDEHVILKDTYTSLFAEKGEVHSERITIKNLGGGKVEGEVYLDDNHIYSLTGTFKNCILTGEFTSVGRYKDERGTINLKLISEDILSGFCSFSKISTLIDDQIRMSPYVWVAGTKLDLVSGTYEFCTACHNEGKKCCCASSDIDMPVLLQNEAQRLQARNPRHQRMRDFSHNIGNTPIRQVNSLNSGTGSQHCHFYDPIENRCTDESEFSYTNWDKYIGDDDIEYYKPDNYWRNEYYIRYANDDLIFET